MEFIRNSWTNPRIEAPGMAVMSHTVSTLGLVFLISVVRDRNAEMENHNAPIVAVDTGPILA